jgi:hypothetical protein
VIGIDELDKMESAQEAARFLGQIKMLFGEQPCFYLVSLSDDAMSEFERRGVPLRTVFDSTFDDVLHVDALSFAEAREIVSGRVVGMGDGHVALCYVLGDAVPRELIRFVRGAIEARAAGARTPAAVARRLVADRQERIERAAMSVAARHPAVDGRHPLLDWLDALPAPTAEALPVRWDIQAPYAALAAHAIDDGDRERQRHLLLELAAVAYRASTVVALWDAIDENVLEAATRAVAPSPVLALLARAGRDLAYGPQTAWRTVDAARAELGLALVPFPVVAEAAGAREPAPRWRRALATAASLFW